MQKNKCDKLTCSFIRCICNISKGNEEFLDVVKEYSTSGHLKNETQRRIEEIFKSEQFESESRESKLFKAIIEGKNFFPKKLSWEEKQDEALMLLIYIIQTVKTQEKKDFHDLFVKIEPYLDSCRAVCYYLYDVLKKDFKDIFFANLLVQKYNSNDHCPELNKNIKEVSNRSKINKLIANQKPTLGYRSIYELGNIIYEKKIKIEKELITQNNDNNFLDNCKSIVLFVLRRFNSFSPIINLDENFGGGYFLYDGKNKEGICIDPGNDFIKIFLDKGFSLNLINTIIVTHAHPDHLGDLLNIITLLWENNEYELNNSINKSKFIIGEEIEISPSPPVKIYVNESTFAYLSGVIDLSVNNKTYEIETISPGMIIDLTKQIELIPLPTEHKDLKSNNKGIGLLLRERKVNSEGKKMTFLYTSDTSISKNLIKQYKLIFKNNKISKIDTALCNIGGIHKKELYSSFLSDLIIESQPKCPDKRYTYKNHLGIIGLGFFIKHFKPSSILLGELGIELAEYRIELMNCLSKEFKIPCIVTDIGMTIKIFEEVCLAKEEKETAFISFNKINAIQLGENIHYFNKELRHKDLTKKSTFNDYRF